MKLKTQTGIIGLIIILVSISACSAGQKEPTPQPTLDVAAQTFTIQSGTVSAEAIVTPIQQANLAFESGGRIVALNVSEGDMVEQGDVLAQVDDAIQQAGLIQAQAGLEQATAAVAQAAAGLASAQAGVSEAEATLAKVIAGATPAEIARLEANVVAAEAVLTELLNSPSDEAVLQALAAVEIAEAQLNEILAGAREEDIRAASATVLQAQSAVRVAQTAYDRVRYGDPADVAVAGSNLETATLNYEIAQAQLDKLTNGATAEQIAIGQAGVDQAQAALASVMAGATPEQIAQAQANVLQAQAALNQAKEGATAEDIAIAQANVERAKSALQSAEANLALSKAGVTQAQAAVDAAQVQVNNTQLLAPFDGQASAITINVGDLAVPGQPIITLGNNSQWQVKTSDLNELDIINVKPGASAAIDIDALPGEDFKGQVASISPAAVTIAGDQIYTVLVNITEGDTSKLLWGMTALVNIDTE